MRVAHVSTVDRDMQSVLMNQLRSFFMPFIFRTFICVLNDPLDSLRDHAAQTDRHISGSCLDLVRRLLATKKFDSLPSTVLTLSTLTLVDYRSGRVTDSSVTDNRVSKSRITSNRVARNEPPAMTPPAMTNFRNISRYIVNTLATVSLCLINSF